MTITPTDVLRAYTRQFEGAGHDPATEDEILNEAMDSVLNMRKMDVPLFEDYDINQARRQLASTAEHLGLPVDEYLGALNYVSRFVAERLDAVFEIERVLGTFRELVTETTKATL